MLSFLNANGRPAAAFNYDQMRPYSTFGETADAAMRSQARISTLGAADTELDVLGQARSELQKNFPEKYQAWESSSYRRGFDQYTDPFQKTTAEDYLPKLNNRDEIRSSLAERGLNFSDDIPVPEEGMTIARAIVYQRNYEAEMADRAVTENARPGVSGFAANVSGGILGALADPVNYIPLANGLNRARMLTKGTNVFSRAGLRTLGRSAAIGSTEGVGGALIADAVTFPLANRWGAGLGWEELAADLTLSGILGAGLSSFGTIIGPRKVAKIHQDGMVKAAADDATGRPVDVGSMFSGFDALVELRAERIARRQTEYARSLPSRHNAFDQLPTEITPEMKERARVIARNEILGPRTNELLQARRDYINNLRGRHAEFGGFEPDAGLVERMRNIAESEYRANTETPLISPATRYVEAPPLARKTRAGNDPSMPIPPGRAGEAKSISFEKAGPEQSVIDAQNLERAADQWMSDNSPNSLMQAIDDVEVEMVAAQVNKLAEAGNIPRGDMEELNAINGNIERAKQERMAFADAVECILLGGSYNG